MSIITVSPGSLVDKSERAVVCNNFAADIECQLTCVSWHWCHSCFTACLALLQATHICSDCIRANKCCSLLSWVCSDTQARRYLLALWLLHHRRPLEYLTLFCFLSSFSRFRRSTAVSSAPFNTERCVHIWAPCYTLARGARQIWFTRLMHIKG